MTSITSTGRQSDLFEYGFDNPYLPKDNAIFYILVRCIRETPLVLEEEPEPEFQYEYEQKDKEERVYE